MSARLANISLGRTSLGRIPHVGSLGIILALLILGQFVNPSFLSPMNLWAVLSVSALLAVASAGQTLVIISGNQGIDLSVGSVMTLTALIVSGMAGSSDAAVPMALAVVLGLGTLIGLANGIGARFLGLYPLVVTLGVSFVVEGLGLVYARSRPPQMPGPMIENIGIGRFLGIPWLVLIGAAVTVAMTLLLRKSRYGRQLYLVGSNIRAASAAGIPVTRVLLTTWAASGFLAAFAGVLLYGYVASANLSVGAPYTMMSIAAAVIGGTALSGGAGSFVGTVLGAVIFSLITNLLIMLGLGPALRYAISGLVLILVLFATSRDAR
ncbi:ABC transporter permease [Paenirhodobacter populi]|uniref:Autoinducer 2 import system permease protein LsrD n=1 Tax=Paenirhodobacter populi TaxID=2306993 RepID=A0A443J4R5_9RHOB|nr:ABC transporter permease [Sinirhodobacter populi]RWR15313.1 ABC transporter permease [Sinirhodobacter populi]